jgi:CBS domain containing-hemolysin-like protein
MEVYLSNKKESKKNKKKNDYKKWVIVIVLWTLVISTLISLLANVVLQAVNLFLALIILVFIIFIGIISDLIGVAVTAANEIPFHSMSSRKVKGAKEAVNLVRNADKVSNFCNDVIGDICGVISGAVGALILVKVIFWTQLTGDNIDIIIGSIIGAIIAALTVGGKAIGKSIAIGKSNEIVFAVARVINLMKRDR